MPGKIQKNSILGFTFPQSESLHGDRLFILSIALLCAVGILMVYSSSFYMAWQDFRNPYYFLKRHSLRLLIGFVAFMAAYKFNYHHLRRWSIIPLIISIILLIWVLITGSRWISVGGITLQPSEFARIALLVYLADWCSRNANKLRQSPKGFLFVLTLVMITTGLVMAEPSYSAAVMILISGVALLVMSGVKWRYLIAAALPILPVAGYMAVAASYRFRRVFSFLNPLADPQGAGYHTIQSKIAVGSGQIWGFGFGMSGQKFHFLPESHCDFIFSILCEERGFIGAALVLLLFILFFWRGIRIAVKARDHFGFLLAGSLIFCIAFFALVNIGVALGSLPVTGLPLPFISYGGSALITNLLACGIVLNVSKHNNSPELT
ncbi:putative lipid II flippase FtsW [candidate division LCP-89 bacterium B3_LCP]|uniref:Probable peptidoglycan glycosyltransferase FtsW n=1 Tax=candidate division LCP-89 bacterium B3_LCP TaxID=2012998 RepID=A0A532V2W5_UNCL8|nr:MAG: putative lipid II flippase FtsW [candidate division LCP-89 bacterium B3_LCP]